MFLNSGKELLVKLYNGFWTLLRSTSCISLNNLEHRMFTFRNLGITHTKFSC